MTFFRGHKPSKYLAIALLCSCAAQAQQTSPLTIVEAEQLALRQEPGQLALLSRAAAYEEQAVASGQLPDPTMRIGLANYPISSGGFSTEGMTQAQLGFRQDFPSGKSRTLGTQQARSMSHSMLASADARKRDVQSSLRHAWLEAFYWQHASEIVTRSRPFFADLVEVTQSSYAVGRKTQHDVLRAELELSRLDDRLIQIDRRRSQAKADLSQWLGQDANRPVASNLPAWEQVPTLELLQQQLATHPIVLAADASVAAHSANVELAEERKKPGWSLDLGYGFRDGYLANGDPRSDFVSLSVTVDIPFFQKNRQDRKLAAALSERSASEYEKQELLRQLASQLDSEYARWQDLSRRLVLYDSQILSLSENQAQAALLAYQSEAGDFADVMRGYIDDLNTRLDYMRLQIERAQSYSALANLGGITQ